MPVLLYCSFFAAAASKPELLVCDYSCHINRGIALKAISDLLSANVASRFLFPNKGKIAPGFDADFALVDLKQTFAVAKEDLLYRHPQSPYIGRALTGRVVQTILRGRTIYKDGKIIATGGGKLIKPA